MGGTSEPSRKHYILQCLCAICHRTERSFQYGERVETESQTWQSLWHLMKCHNKSKSPACLPDYTKAQPEKLLQTGFGYYWRGDGDVDVMQRAIHDFVKTRTCDDDDACSLVHTSIPLASCRRGRWVKHLHSFHGGHYHWVRDRRPMTSKLRGRGVGPKEDRASFFRFDFSTSVQNAGKEEVVKNAKNL